MIIRKKTAFLFGLITTIVIAENQNWSTGTSHTLEKGRWEVGVFQPLSYGFKNNIELSTHPAWAFLIPNFSVKKFWLSHNELALSSRHNIVYPTPIFKWLQSPLGKELGEPDKFALISPEFDIPPIVSFHNELLISRPISRGGVTFKAGMTFAFISGGLDDRVTIDLPIVFHRMMVMQNGYGFNVGVDLLHQLTAKLLLWTDVDFILIPGVDENFAMENKGILIYERNHNFRTLIGYKLVYGKYPAGYPLDFKSFLHILPILDLQWGWGF